MTSEASLARKKAGFIVLVVCSILAILVLTESIAPVAGGWLFAFALAVLGIQSRGLGKQE